VYIAAEEAGFVTTAPLIHDMEEQGKMILDEAKRVVQASGIEADTAMVHGIPPEEIIKKAQTDSYDLIVIGSRGRTAATSFLLGSVSDRVSHHARCPVLIIK
jgi:nucleotide-binding universal stress UspA family protein